MDCTPKSHEHKPKACFVGREALFEGSTNFSLAFIQYENPKDQKADGRPCDYTFALQGQNFCDHIFQFCVSALGKE